MECLPRRDHINSTPIIESRPSQRVHNTSHRPLRTRINWTSQTIKERCTWSNEHQASVFLWWRWRLPVLFDEVVGCEFCGVECAFEVYIDGFEVWFGGLSVVACWMSKFRCSATLDGSVEDCTCELEDFILRTNSCVGDDVIHLACEACSCLEESQLIFPLRNVALYEFSASLKSVEWQVS